MDGKIIYGLARVVNPKTKDGSFRATGGGYDKCLAVLEDVAIYVEENAEDRDEVEVNLYRYIGKNQNYNTV